MQKIAAFLTITLLTGCSTYKNPPTTTTSGLAKLRIADKTDGYYEVFMKNNSECDFTANVFKDITGEIAYRGRTSTYHIFPLPGHRGKIIGMDNPDEIDSDNSAEVYMQAAKPVLLMIRYTKFNTSCNMNYVIKPKKSASYQLDLDVDDAYCVAKPFEIKSASKKVRINKNIIKKCR